MKNGWSSRRPDMTYKFCCGKISVVVYSSSTPASALITKSSGISSSFQVDVFVFYGYAPLLHPEIFVFFQFHVRHVLETSSTLTSTRSLCILWTFTCSILTWTHSGKVRENVQNNLTQTSGQKTGTVMFSQSPLFSHMNSV